MKKSTQRKMSSRECFVYDIQTLGIAIMQAKYDVVQQVCKHLTEKHDQEFKEIINRHNINIKDENKQLCKKEK